MKNQLINNNKYLIGALALSCALVLIGAINVSSQCTQEFVCLYSEYSLGFLIVPATYLIYITSALILVVASTKRNTSIYDSIELWQRDYAKLFILTFAIGAITISLHQNVFITYSLSGPMWLLNYNFLLGMAPLFLICSVFTLRRNSKLSIANYLLVLVPAVSFVIFYMAPILIASLNTTLMNILDSNYYLYGYLVTVCTVLTVIYTSNNLNSRFQKANETRLS